MLGEEEDDLAETAAVQHDHQHGMNTKTIAFIELILMLKPLCIQ